MWFLCTQTQTVPVEGGEPASELSIMQKLLMPAAEVLAMDATDFTCGDRLLEGMGKNVSTDRAVHKLPLDTCTVGAICCNSRRWQAWQAW